MYKESLRRKPDPTVVCPRFPAALADSAAALRTP